MIKAANIAMTITLGSVSERTKLPGARGVQASKRRQPNPRVAPGVAEIDCAAKKTPT